MLIGFPAPDPKSRLCTRCGTVEVPKKFEYEGSSLLELLLWLFLLIPGLIYTVWRLRHKRPICSACGSRDMIPLGTPRAREMLAHRG